MDTRSVSPDRRIDIDLIVARIGVATARELASAVARMIRDEQVRPGDRLPRVRDLAQALRISPSTVSAAWTLLRERGLVEGRGKSGTSIRSTDPAATESSPAPAAVRHDLRYVLPDAALLPRLDAALRFAGRQPGLSEYDKASIAPALRDRVQAGWAFRCEAFIAASGATDGLWLALRALTVPGDRVLLEAPGPPPLIRIVRSLGLIPVEIDSDPDGPTVHSVRQGLKADPVVVVYQPRAQVPTGRFVSHDRLAELRRLIEPRALSVLEFDDIGDLSTVSARSMGQYLPERVVIVKAYEKSHGPDLRMAVIGGSQHFVAGIHGHMLLERQWTSRILQGALAWLLADAGSQNVIAAARQEYHRRLTLMRTALGAVGIRISAADGLCLWIPVADETAALRRAAEQGVLLYQGSNSFPSGRRGFVRMATSRLTGDHESIARTVALAAAAH